MVQVLFHLLRFGTHRNMIPGGKGEIRKDTWAFSPREWGEFSAPWSKSCTQEEQVGGKRRERKGEGPPWGGLTQVGPAHPCGSGQPTLVALFSFENYILILVNRNRLNRVYLYLATFKFSPFSAFCGNSMITIWCSLSTHSYSWTSSFNSVL